jgi:hypothetical protein
LFLEYLAPKPLLKLGKLRRAGQPKTAVVDLEENRDRFEFMNNVLSNRGFNVRVFSNAVDAERWLGESEGVSSLS